MKKLKSLCIISAFWTLSVSPAQAQCDTTYLSQVLQGGQMLADYIWNFFPINEEQEEEIGNEMFDYMKENFKLIPNDKRQKKLEKILDKLTPFVFKPGIKYEIHLVDDNDLINAFSIAGGHLFVTTGIMSWVESDDELAFIIGHEIGHVDLGHCVRHVQRKVSIQAISDYFEMGKYSGIIDQVQEIAGTPFGQADEYSADRAGAYYTWKAGYNPAKGKDFFNKLKKNEKNGGTTLEVLLRSHPFSEQRANCLDYYIKNELKK